MRGFRRLSFERGFAPLCRLSFVGSRQSTVGSDVAFGDGIGHWALGSTFGDVIGILVYWYIGDVFRRLSFVVGRWRLVGSIVGLAVPNVSVTPLFTWSKPIFFTVSCVYVRLTWSNLQDIILVGLKSRLLIYRAMCYVLRATITRFLVTSYSLPISKTRFLVPHSSFLVLPARRIPCG